MNKPIKIALLSLLGIPLIALAALFSIFLFKDANDFKPTIEIQAKAQAGLNINIIDELSWSLSPIGLNVNQLEILDQDNALFASVEQLVISIDFWSLFRGSPKVETILLDGLSLNLIQTSETENNWSKVLQPNNTSTDKHENTQTPSNASNSLNFLIESFQLINTSILFKSVPQDIDLAISPLNLTISDITLGDTFPLTLSYSLNETNNQISIKSSLNANLFASKDLTQFALSDLQNNYDIAAPSLSEQAIDLSISSNMTIDTTAESVNIASMLVSLNNLAVEGDAVIKQYRKDLTVSSSINIPEFSLKTFLSRLGINLPPMQNDKALELASFSSTISVENNIVNINNLAMNLDQSQWFGSISHHLNSSASKVRLQGNQITLDDYFPIEDNPKAENDTHTESQKSSTPASDKQQALLPLDTLKKLNLDIGLIQNSLSAKGIQTTDLETSFTAKQGKLTHTLAGQLFEGNYSSTAMINVATPSPSWTGQQTLNNIDLAPIFERLNIEAIKEYGSVAGLLNLTAKTQMAGNHLDTLKSSAVSEVDFHVEEGAFEGLSLNALTCKGFALINKESVDTSTWPKATPFKTLQGSAALKDQTLSTTFDLITSGIHADSRGTVDISESSLNILASLKVIGELGDNACRVHDKVTKIGIPIICEGALETPPAELCQLDTSRLGNMAKELAIAEGKRKANKELERALDKHLGDKKDAVKSLLKQFLK